MEASWTEHSWRSALASFCASLGVGQAGARSLNPLARWKAEPSEEYARISRHIVERAQLRIAQFVRSGYGGPDHFGESDTLDRVYPLNLAPTFLTPWKVGV